MKSVLRIVTLGIVLGLLLLVRLPAQTADVPSVDTFKRVLDQALQKLLPVGSTERNVLFEEVRSGSLANGKYPFQVSAYVRDYGPGYPANQYYGATCVGHMDKWTFELSHDAFGEWIVQGRMSILSDDGKQCKPNPSAGVSSMPLASLAGSPAPSAAKPAAADAPAPTSAATQSAANQSMALDEIARRVIRKQRQIVCSLSGIGAQTSAPCDRDSVPTRVTFDSVQVNGQGTDNYPVNVKFSVWSYYRDSTLVYDYEGGMLLYKTAGGWDIRNDSANMKPGRYLAATAAPAPGATDVPAPSTVSASANNNKIAAAITTVAAVPLGHYNCVASAGGQLIHVGGFTLQADGVYSDEDKGRGTFVYDSNQHQITFKGAAMGGQVGRYDSKSTFTLKSDRSSVDCDRGN